MLKIHAFLSAIILILCVCTVHSAVIDHDPEKIPRFPYHRHPLLSNLPLARSLSENSNEFFLNQAKEFVKQQTEQKLNEKIARNVVFFLGDGMSVSTIAAARNLLGGEEKKLAFESFPFVGMAKTYCVDSQIADSACTSTAYLCGVKGNSGTIGVSAKVQQQNCTQGLDKNNHAESIAKWAIDAGKSVGFVTNTRVTHATPAGLYAHSAYRKWETDEDVRNSNCDDLVVNDIAEQLVFGEVGKKLKVIFGCGREGFRDHHMRDEAGYPGRRNDKKDLIEEWLKQDVSTDRRHYVWNKNGMISLHKNNTDSVLGLFDVDHCKYNYEIDGISDSVPTLAEMTMKAIELLSQNEKGFLLFVEGGRIDMAHHKSMAHIALDETIAFSKAIDHAKDLLEDDTLLLVTADHSHAMSYAGYGLRGTNVFGVGGRSDKDNLPYMRLSYANGVGYSTYRNESGYRIDPSKLNLQRADVLFPATVPRKFGTHGGDDTPVYAIGPHSHLFTGNYEQNVIPYIIAYAACIGNGLTACSAQNNEI